MIRRAPSLTEQVKLLLKQRIINAEFEAGRIPSETELANELGVSRTTIRDALSRLELEGAIYRRQGAGTFVNEASLQLKMRLEEIWSYEAMLQAHDYTPSTRILGVTEQPVDSKTAAELDLASGETMLVVRKLFLANDQPVIFTINELPTRLIKQPYSEAAFQPPIYQFLSEFCQQHLAYYLSDITPLIAPDWLGDILNLPARQPTALISFEEVGYNQENRPILKARSYFKDELLRLRLMRREA
jgi:GntR family transcriptional regulator